ncbi:MAG TPA: hypothetical protein VNH83_03440 [Bryobacteraceae bacterium]|nr:hypothetical protein [Bryobacteraceae bacterium]
MNRALSWIRRSLFIVTPLLFSPPLSAQTQHRWKVAHDGGVTWDVRPDDSHQDHIEMSGRQVSVIVSYGVRENGVLILTYRIAFPSLRILPNDKSGTLSYVFGEDAAPRIFIDGRLAAKEVVIRIHHRGLMTIDSLFGNGDIALTRTIFPSNENPAVVEKYSFTNRSAKAISVEVEDTQKTARTNAARGVTGEYLISSEVLPPRAMSINPGQSANFALAFTAREVAAAPPQIDANAEDSARNARVNGFLADLQLETPDPVLNTAFALAKIRAAESIYRTKGGLMHGSGGGGYATIWANDQIEYANPFFPFLGDRVANEAAINELRLFDRYMNADYKPLPNAVVAEGTGAWMGPGDRGDMAMIAYGAARFALAYGDRKTAEELWKLITWCLEYCRRRLNDAGVVASESDELEGRYPAGKANLCTSSLYYDALNSAVLLGRDLGRTDAELGAYREQAGKIRAAIATYFGAKIQGFEAYRYYAGNDVLRAWIGIPLTVGIYDRKDGTIDALFSPTLWTEDGLLSQAGEKVFFDRSTLYALRGAFAAGKTDRALDLLKQYTNRRLLGDHVPYPIEWGPEGTQPHLAAESALYCRVFTEGVFGIRPTGFRSFDITPALPKAWDRMQLKNVYAFGSVFDLAVIRAGDKLSLEIVVNGRHRTAQVVDAGATVRVNFDPRQ